MQAGRFEDSVIWVVRIDPGEDVLVSLKKFIAEKGIRQGAVVWGYGTLSKARLHWVTHNRLPPENKFDEREGGIELLSINGLIVDGQPHIHFTASTPDGAFGGHLEEGCTCYILCEVGIAELRGPEMRREMATVAHDERGRAVKLPQLRFWAGPR